MSSVVISDDSNQSTVDTSLEGKMRIAFKFT